ncbi:ATP-binding protein [Kaistia dalseonensis]|uniref:histidine kinase n=1 Tax=Kaistia dalseonensis TaxID=410840 RepID=A0ABU0H9W7_9HYPH|nr:ATP-binding protein [Kaistia dalseonensis]MCX5496497.1 ATP-binding protein [Kaistia dalseonensis]MDQ0439119.1 two-component system sensor histidine kinase RegB [Kaistia dalseonensis]
MLSSTRNAVLRGAIVDDASRQADSATNRKNMILLIQLRWIAVAGQIVTIAVVDRGLGIVLPIAPMSGVLAALVLLNLASLAWLRHREEVSNRALLTSLMCDVAALTVQLYLSGGATNPFTSLYLLQVTLGAVLLDALSTSAIVAVACAGFAMLTVFFRPLMLPDHGTSGLFSLHIAGMAVGFGLDAALLVVFVTRITRNLRERDARLAALKQHAVEEDHIVRMGLLASGAAHELGTPLSSLSVIINDWARMPKIASDPDLAQELDEMKVAVQRCKTILTGVLMSAGEARGEAPRVMALGAFLDEMVAEWRAARSVRTLSYGKTFGVDLPIIADSALKQVIFNVLDNALEASPGFVDFAVEREEDMLVLRVSDAGSGFAPEMLAQFGKPYQSSKGRQGGGLGLFLVVNVVRKLGGVVSAENRPEGGAAVTLRLPLATLTIGESELAR